jgi:glycine oxidase
MRILIVGAGLAGTSLAHLLAEKGIDFKLIDNQKNVSSTVAGGIINPLVFRRMTLSWRVHELIPFARDFFARVEEKLELKFYHDVPIRRFFASEQEAEFWIKKQERPEFEAYMTPLRDTDKNFPSPLNHFGTAVVKESGYIEAAKYIHSNWDYFEKTGKLSVESIDYDLLDPEKGTYKGESFEYIVFCEGKDSLYNPWFGYLPLQATKGDVLTIQCEGISQNESLNRKCFMMPIGEHQFRVGSTYIWDTDNTIPTEEGRITLEENLRSLIAVPYTVTNHIAGVRPTVLDRRPLMGKHPTYPKLVIANGLGAKGYMLAPLLMKELTEYLLEDKPLNPETRISRFDFKEG